MEKRDSIVTAISITSDHSDQLESGSPTDVINPVAEYEKYKNESKFMRDSYDDLEHAYIVTETVLKFCEKFDTKTHKLDQNKNLLKLILSSSSMKMEELTTILEKLSQKILENDQKDSQIERDFSKQLTTISSPPEGQKLSNDSDFSEKDYSPYQFLKIDLKKK